MVYEITNLIAREVLDSRGALTLEVEVYFNNDRFGRCIVPAGMSKGKLEAVSLYDDNERKTLGVAMAKLYDVVLPAVIGKSFADQVELDSFLIELDGTSNKANLGANVTLGVSIAFARAMSASMAMPLYVYVSELAGTTAKMPRPFINIINGGAHANNGLLFQEFMIVPPCDIPFKEGILMMRDVFIKLRNILKKSGHSIAVGDEGGFAPAIASETDALDLLCDAAKGAGYNPGSEVFFALDVAAGHFFVNEQYILSDKKLDAVNLINHYVFLCSKYPIISIEDPVAEDDIEGWKVMTQKLGGSIQIVGDDVFVTNKTMLGDGIKNGLANAILIKPNQVGTLLEAIDAAKLALANNYKIMISHRSGDSEDCSIADIAVGLGGGQIKTGSLCRSERTAKYNELLRIAEVLDYD